MPCTVTQTPFLALNRFGEEFDLSTLPSGGSTEVADGVTILGTGTAGDPFRVAPDVACGVVYFDGLTPATSTIFDDENPPVADDPALHDLTCATYVSAVDGSFWTWNGTSYLTKVFTDPLHQRDVFSATAGQTTFTLTKTPIGGTEKVHFTRNGVDVSHAIVVTGNVVTYLPASNGGCTVDASDRIIAHYESY